MNKYLLTYLLLFTFFSIYGQDEKRLHKNGITISLAQKWGIGNLNYEGTILPNESHGTEISLGYNFDLNARHSFGAEAGLYGMRTPGHNLFPIRFNYNFQPTNLNWLRLRVSVGYAVKFGSTFENGLNTDFGIYYRVPFIKNNRCLIGFGVSQQAVQDVSLLIISNNDLETINTHINVISLEFKINYGFQF